MAGTIDVCEFGFKERLFPLRHGHDARLRWRAHGALANHSFGIHVVVGRDLERGRRCGPHVIAQRPNPQLAMTCPVDESWLREHAPTDYVQLFGDN